jgi:hypothetical protein
VLGAYLVTYIHVLDHLQHICNSSHSGSWLLPSHSYYVHSTKRLPVDLGSRSRHRLLFTSISRVKRLGEG